MANEVPGHHIDIYRRSDFVGKIKEDRSTQGCLIVGQTGIVEALDTDERWQIRRITLIGGVLTTEYANNAKYNLKWSDRASYFAPCPPDLDPLPGDTNTNVVKAPPTVKWIEIAAPDTEQSYTLPTNSKRFQVLNYSNKLIRFAYETGKAAEMVPVTDNEYWPLEPATTYGEEELTGAITFYVESSFAGTRMVVKSWQQ